MLDAVTPCAVRQAARQPRRSSVAVQERLRRPRPRRSVVLEVTIAGSGCGSSGRQRSSDLPNATSKMTEQKSSVSVEQPHRWRVAGSRGRPHRPRRQRMALREDWLNADQFTQVVLLPHGQFAEFLRAEDDVREKLVDLPVRRPPFQGCRDVVRSTGNAPSAGRGRGRRAGHPTVHQSVTIAGPDADRTGPDRVDADWFQALAARFEESATLALAARDTAITACEKATEQRVSRRRDRSPAHRTRRAPGGHAKPSSNNARRSSATRTGSTRAGRRRPAADQRS